jgi:hypothetical protein
MKHLKSLSNGPVEWIDSTVSFTAMLIVYDLLLTKRKYFKEAKCLETDGLQFFGFSFANGILCMSNAHSIVNC